MLRHNYTETIVYYINIYEYSYAAVAQQTEK